VLSTAPGVQVRFRGTANPGCAFLVGARYIVPPLRCSRSRIKEREVPGRPRAALDSYQTCRTNQLEERGPKQHAEQPRNECRPSRVWVRAILRACAKVAADIGTTRIRPSRTSLDSESRTACSSEARNSFWKRRQLSALLNSNSANSVAKRAGLTRFMTAAAAEELASGTKREKRKLLSAQAIKSVRARQRAARRRKPSGVFCQKPISGAPTALEECSPQ